MSQDRLHGLEWPLPLVIDDEAFQIVEARFAALGEGVNSLCMQHKEQT